MRPISSRPWKKFISSAKYNAIVPRLSTQPGPVALQAREHSAAQPHSIRADLRALTQAAHSRVDTAFSHLNLTDPAGYATFLQAHYAVLPACERALAASGAASLLADWPSRVRTPALRADMAAIGAQPGIEIAEMAALSPAAAFGAMYVLEGSRLGGAILARRLLANPDARCRAASRYLRHGEGQHLWPSFIAALDSAPHVQADRHSAIASALHIFSLFETAANNTRDAP
jgi:heme oxygenase